MQGGESGQRMPRRRGGCRAATGHRDVLRYGRLDGAVGHRSRTAGRVDPALSGRGRRRDRTLWRFRRQVHGRRRAGLFRLSLRLRGCCGARGSRRDRHPVRSRRPRDARWPRLQARIGIATGLVVVGEIIGTGIAQERTIVGETPISPRGFKRWPAPTASRHASLPGGLLELETHGAHELKGFARPVPAWQVVGEARSRAALPRSARRGSARRPRARNGADARTLASGASGRRPDRHPDRRGRIGNRA